MDSSKNMTAQHRNGSENSPLRQKMVRVSPSLKAYRSTSRMPLTTDHELRVENPGEAESKKVFKK